MSLRDERADLTTEEEMSEMTSGSTKERRASDFWETPRGNPVTVSFSKAAFSHLHEIFDFDVDAAAERANARIPVWFGPGSPVDLFDSLRATPAEWLEHGRRFFLNPPLSKPAGPVSKWVEKAELVAATGNALVVCCLPATPATQWFGRHAVHGPRFFPTARIKFVPPPDLKTKNEGARHDSFVLVFAGRLWQYGVWL